MFDFANLGDTAVLRVVMGGTACTGLRRLTQVKIRATRGNTAVRQLHFSPAFWVMRGNQGPEPNNGRAKSAQKARCSGDGKSVGIGSFRTVFTDRTRTEEFGCGWL